MVFVRLTYIILFLTCWFPLNAQKIPVLDVDGVINPVTAGYIERGIKKAASEQSPCVVIQLNTPGGLLKSTRVIVTQLLESPVPVIVFVAPNGAHAGSAGVFITLAGHIATMVPGSNIGAAHPVSMQQMDSVMSEKVTHDAAAFIRSIAQYRKRDTVWAELAVRESVSITASEALQKGVIDLLANDLEELLRAVDGKTVVIGKEPLVLRTAGVPFEKLPMSFAEKLLLVLTDPSIAYILMTVGFLGLILELYSPGAVFPGVIGGICLILALYAMHTLPVNMAGAALILLAVILFILEISVVSYGILTIGGLIALLLGSLMLFRSSSPLEYVQFSRRLIYTVVASAGAFFLLLLLLGVRAQRTTAVTGAEAMIGKSAQAQEDFSGSGMVMLMGELWKADSGGQLVQKGQSVRVTAVKGLLLLVEPI